METYIPSLQTITNIIISVLEITGQNLHRCSILLLATCPQRWILETSEAIVRSCELAIP